MYESNNNNNNSLVLNSVLPDTQRHFTVLMINEYVGENMFTACKMVKWINNIFIHNQWLAVRVLV